MVDMDIADSHKLLDQILGKRGISRGDLQAGIDSLPDEALLANIGEVADRISKAMFRNEPLVIFGHDDPDGITSTYILYQFFNSCGYQKHNYFIPNRNLEPHGIQQSFIDYVKDHGYKLAITVDNGIASYEGVEKLRLLGCDTIVTDHHLIQPEQMPNAYTILNPQLPQCQYPYKQLAGVGVVLMLIRYLGRILEHPVPPSSYFWTAVGSVADKVAMTGVNRIIVRQVFENWEDMLDPSVEFLLRNHSRIGNATDIFNFIQATARLIANGREPDGQHTAMRFLLERGDAKAELFQSMEAQKNKWEGELNKVFSLMDSVSSGFEGSAFIYFDDEGVIPYTLLGTAATYILSKFNVPTIMLRTHNGNIVCEGRCSDGFNMVDAFRHCKEHLKQFGGHVKAAGFTLEAANYDAFLECYNDYLTDNLPSEKTEKRGVAEAEARLTDFNRQNWEDLELLLPFGMQNPEPLFMVRNTNADELHQVFTLEHGSASLPNGKSGDAELFWKGLQSARLAAFHVT